VKNTTLLTISADHPTFAGHFPGMPIVPGVVLLDEAMHAIANAIDHNGAWQIGSVKFLSPLGPGTHVIIEHEAQTSGAIRFDIREGERPIVSGSITPVTAS
jgi:3-hydroxyacyl-[acyl-carrier-protein] dehydratase